MAKTLPYLAFLLTFVGAIFVSCNEEQSSPTGNQKMHISLELSKRVAMNFSKSKRFLGTFASGRGFITEDSTDRSAREIENAYAVLEGDEAVFYVLSFKPSGFVLVSATAKTEPILAHSNAGHFDINRLPVGLNQWVDAQKQRIVTIKNSNTKASYALLRHWDSNVGSPNWRDPETGKPDPVPNPSAGAFYTKRGPLLETTWGQGCGYNALIEVNCSSGGRCGKAYTGCVATAMAQIIRYHRYPAKYNYGVMPAYLINANNSAGAVEIAKLMRDAAVAVGMNYGCNASGANTKGEVASSFIHDFGYASASYSDYGSSGYEKVMREIALRRPVIFKGGSKKYWAGIIPYYADGHTWVCDGYTNSRLSDGTEFYSPAHGLGLERILQWLVCR